ncbi:MAG: SCP2 sterol-binding domain-containing protein [Zoogloea sp.]|uniref:ubiquinone biosynthesis accessory factor UbiJ n=1 Tax=Zoogloea sp. TaxID=49181 RepID=UPI001A4DCDB2|nr:SCP2 sterol-binding domain-containing protein [Zoogloea sp.]
MLNSSVIAGLNHILSDAPWARERLVPFAGRSTVFVLKPVELGLGIDVDGYFTEAATTTPDVTLELPLASLPKLIGGPDALTADIRISGNAELADTLGFVLRKLRWDGEEALSRLVGDIAAHRSMGLFRGLADWHKQTAHKFIENLSEYLSEEQAVLIKRHDLESLARESAVLRDDLARLNKRLEKLESAT